MKHHTDFHVDDQDQLFALLLPYPTSSVRVNRTLAQKLLKENARMIVDGGVRWFIIRSIGLDIYEVKLRLRDPAYPDENIKNTIFTG